MKFLFLYIDDLATLLGIVSNFLLILAVKKRTAPSFKSYGTMVLVSGAIDLFYAIIILLCHHQLQFTDGVMLINSYALDPYLPLWPRLVLGSLEHFCVLEAIIILPVQYYYRYFLMSRTAENKDHVFYWLTFITVVCSGGMMGLCIWSNIASMKRGQQYYISMLDTSIIHGDPIDTYVCAVDMRDLAAVVYMGWAGFVMNVCYCGAIYYCYKSISQVAPQNGIHLSKKAASMRAEFTRNLLVQTLNSWIFAMCPMFIIAVAMFFKLKFGKFNILFMSVMAWAPAANGVFSLIIIKPYRQFILRTFDSSSAPTQSVSATASSKPVKKECTIKYRHSCPNDV